ncbi:unnamed protein product [Haemonchus placei]|uniref:SURF6 domain-containing protein n=1 Tax=Haemonchus placei TaxID=6290 RepID=A0A0N4X562_HAEPC|nr:unnamed protein product [Haemonchus placei]
MASDVQSPGVDLSRIASIEGKFRHICDLIPISTWGFTAEVHKKLRERKHRIVNQQLTTKEKQKLTKNKKQQVARSVGGICNKVSEVIDLFSTSHGRDTKVKKSVDPSTQPKLEDRKKQTEKKEKRKEIPSEPKTSATENLIKESSSIAKEGLPSGSDDSSDGESTEQHVESVPVVKSKKRPSSQPTAVEPKKSKFDVVEKREEKLEKLREKEPEKAAELEHDIKWKRALSKAQGIKMKDNMELLKKGMKRKEKMKEKRKENWSNRRLGVEKEKAKRQEKREENIGKRINDKKKRKLQTMRKKGRVL